MKRKIILASTSPRRQGLLQQIGLKFEVIPSNYEENMNLKLPPKKLVMKLAEGKAEDVVKKVKEGVVIGVDTFVVYKEKKLGKPLDEKDAYKMLKLLSGKTLEIYSGVCIIDVENNKKIIDFEVSKVKIKKMSDEEILSYIKSGEPMDKAGSFGIQGLGAIFIERIEGCYSNIVGLPLYNLYKNLKKLDINILKN